MPFNFLDGPSGQVMNGDDFWTQAAASPFSTAYSAATSFQQGAGSTVENIVEQLNTPGGRQMVPIDPTSNDHTSLNRLRPETDQEIQDRGDKRYGSEQAYKDSPEYRATVPYNDDLTVNQAKALSTWADLAAQREAIQQSHPIVSGVSGFVGGAANPVNFIPVIGEESLLARGLTAGLGEFGGLTARSALDAGMNAGIGNLLTREVRSAQGEDTSWQAEVSNIALNAAFGGAIGAIHGGLKIREAARTQAIIDQLKDDFTTIQDGRASMATLQDAMSSLVHDDEIRLSDNSIQHLTQTADRFQRAAPEAFADNEMQATLSDKLSQLADLRNNLDTNTKQLADINTELSDNGTYGQTREAFKEAKQLIDQHQQLSSSLDNVTSEKQRSDIQSAMSNIEERVNQIYESMDQTKAERLQQLEQAATEHGKNIQDVKASHDKLDAELKASRQDIIDRYNRGEYDNQIAERATPSDGTDGSANGYDTSTETAGNINTDTGLRSTLTTPSKEVIGTRKAQPEMSTEAKAAANAVGKPQTFEQIANENGVTMDGKYKEEYMIEQLEKEGRMSDEFKELLNMANDNVEAAKVYGDVLRSAVACIL